MESIILLVIAVGLAFGVGCLGRTRKIGFGLAFVISLFNVIIGLIAVLCSKKIENVEPKKDSFHCVLFLGVTILNDNTCPKVNTHPKLFSHLMKKA